VRAALNGVQRAYFCYPISPGLVQAARVARWSGEARSTVGSVSLFSAFNGPPQRRGSGQGNARRNPATGKQIKIPARLRFTSAKALKDSVADAR
jgi:hypothetical protein